MSGLDALPPLREVIGAQNLTARKSLGQNFLLDLNLTGRIAREAGPLAGRDVLEIGPGPGGLTRALLAEGAAHVLAIERDDRFLPALADIDAASGGRLIVEPADALAADEPALLARHGLTPPVTIVANLPYNVGTALLVKWLTEPRWPAWFSSMTLMFQREVAMRIVAGPGAEFGRLSVLAQWRTRPRILFDVNPRAFLPPPSIVSSVVRLDVIPDPAPAPVKALEAVTAAAFGQRRKMLRASLRTLGRDPLPILAACGIEPTLRAEQLPVAGFLALANAYAD
ncbi:MAG: 16S rRNA (adenine(1518)-N(6)/adenine(1519)-N(6))-dimethyltransferase RsmA [Alphaproteobacteria bacterium]|nr:16S rRNA (adenine(1518)-N(6)/adenine(1519)-N(6))-dimethyltransferase RsmA [Alphaproteobacteria bacterium]